MKKIIVLMLAAALLILPASAETLYWTDTCDFYATAVWTPGGVSGSTMGAYADPMFGYSGSGIGIDYGMANPSILTDGHAWTSRNIIIPSYAANLTYRINTTIESGTDAAITVTFAGSTQTYNTTANWQQGSFDISGLNPGTYAFKIDRWDNHGTTAGNHSFSMDDISVYINDGPYANFTASEPRTGEPGLVVQFYDNSTGSPDAWLWDFGDFHTSTAQNPAHSYGTTGTYDVSLTVSSTVNGTGTTETKAGYVTISDTSHPDTPPHYVKFQVQTGMGAPVPAVNVSAQYVESSSPLEWIFEWFGLSTDIDFQNTTLSGSTASDGSITFLMHEEIKYAVRFEKDDVINLTRYYYPKEDRYVILTVSDAPGVSDWYDDDYDVSRWVTTAITKDDDTGNITVSYLDTLAETQNVTITFSQKDSAGVVTVLNTTVIDSDSDFNATYTAADYQGESYFVSVDAWHDTFGNFVREYGVSFKNFIDILGLSDKFGADTANWAYMMVALFLIIFVGLCFDAFSVGQGMGLVSAIGWITYGMGWLNPIGVAMLPALILVSVLAVIALIMQRKQQEGWS